MLSANGHGFGVAIWSDKNALSLITNIAIR